MATTILLLDDDEAMFRAINRLVRSLDATVLAASSTERALTFCREYEIQVVIADLNRPDIDVNQFLAQVNQINRWTRKIVLTSFAELNSTIDAINSGKINRYFTTPWDANELRRSIVEELNEYLEHRGTSQQLNAMGRRSEIIEEKADFTAKLLDGTAALLAGSHFRAAIRIFLPLLESKIPGARQHAKATARLATKIASTLNLPANEREQIVLAAELHQLGFLGLPDHILALPLTEMSERELTIFQSYPELGASVLADEDKDEPVIQIVRHHQENMDGGGYPSNLVGGFIPLGARIVRIAADFDDRASVIGDERAYRMMLERGSEIYDLKLLKVLGDSLNLGHREISTDDVTRVKGL